MDISELNPFDIFDIEATRLDHFFAAVSAADANKPSRCEGWSIQDVLAHIAGEEIYNQACLDDNIAEVFEPLRAQGVNGYNDFNEWCVRQRRGLPLQSVLDEWRGANTTTRRRMRERGRDGTLATGVGPYPVGLQTFHYCSEFATHADDVYAPIGAEEEPGRTRWRVAVGRFVLDEQERPVTVTDNSTTLDVSTKGVKTTLSAEDFVTATVDRLPESHPLDKRLREVLACLA